MSIRIRFQTTKPPTRKTTARLRRLLHTTNNMHRHTAATSVQQLAAMRRHVIGGGVLLRSAAPATSGRVVVAQRGGRSLSSSAAAPSTAIGSSDHRDQQQPPKPLQSAAIGEPALRTASPVPSSTSSQALPKIAQFAVSRIDRRALLLFFVCVFCVCSIRLALYFGAHFCLSLSRCFPVERNCIIMRCMIWLLCVCCGCARTTRHN